MSIGSRIASATLGMLSRFSPQARHEAAVGWHPGRSNLETTWQSPARDASPAERIEIAKKAMYLASNSALVGGIFERMATFVVGSGINPEPATDDDAFNDDARAAWEEWLPNADFLGLDHYSDVQFNRYLAKLTVGEFFTVKIMDRGEPRVQLVESFRVAGESWSLLDGIKLDAQGRPATYRVCTELLGYGEAFRSGNYEEVEARDVVHHRFARRAVEYRPLPPMRAGLNTAHDVADILAMEKIAVKDACSKTDIIKTKSGEARPNSIARGRYGGQTRTDTADNTTDRLSFYQKTFGPSAKYIGRDDEYTPYIPQRPSPAWQGMMDFLAAYVVMPTGMPPSTLLQIKVGGADTRRDLGAAARVIEKHQVQEVREEQDIYEWVIESKLGKRGRPKNWNHVEWQFPRVITADAGRQSAQDREDIGMGANSLQNFCGENQLGSMMRHLRNVARSKVAVNKVAEEFKLEPREVFNFDHKSQPTLPPEPAPEPAKTPAKTEA